MSLKHCLFYVIFITTLNITAYAEVVLDGTLGRSGALSGPDYLIGADLGQQHGDNLFHSFQSFNLQSLKSLESATFSGPDSVHNIISRVTGGNPSHINGILRSTIPNADMYFLNPAGVIFGPNARLDMPASLYVSTADYLKLEDGGRFDVAQPVNSLLTVAPPSAFGFLDAPIGKIDVNGSWLWMSKDNKLTFGNTLALVGGDINIKEEALLFNGNVFKKSGSLVSVDGHIHLVSVASQGEASINPTSLSDNAFAKFGTISITDSTEAKATNIIGAGNIHVSGSGGGEIFIRAGELLLNNGYVFSDTFGNQHGQGITVQLTDELKLENDSRITTQTCDEMTCQNPIGQTIGNAGDIDISVGQIRLTDGSQIQSSTQTYGNAGSVTVSAENLYIAGSQTLANGKIVNSGILSNTLSSGLGGQIQITAADLVLDNGGEIRADTRGLGDAGDVSISANRLTLFSGAQVDTSAGRQYSQAQGNSGHLTITAKEYMVIYGSKQKDRPSALLANRFTQGEDSDITINTPVLAIADGGIMQASGRLKLNTEVDLIDNFMVLPHQHLDVTKLLNHRCAGLSQPDFSRFVITIRDVFPPSPEDLRTHYFIE
jgi:filamentous hemagglutinin family protein